MPSPSRVNATRILPLPSRRLLIIAAGFVAAAFLLPYLPWLEWPWRLALAILLVFLGIDWFHRPRHAGLLVTREIAGPFHVGRKGEYFLWFENPARQSVSVEIAETLPAAIESPQGEGVIRSSRVLAPGASWRLPIAFLAFERGDHRFPAMGLRVSRPQGLLDYQIRLDSSDSLAVAPGRPAGETSWLLTQVAQIEQIGEKRIRRLGGDWEFESLRDYAVGDEIRQMDWKASARRAKPVLRQFRMERSSELILALDCGRLMGSLVGGARKLDLAMTPLLDVAAVALHRGERVGLICFDSKVRAYLPPRGGLERLGAMSAALAHLPLPEEPTSYLRAVSHIESRHRKRSLILFFTDFTDEVSAQDFLPSLASLAKRHAMIFVGVSDPHLEEVIAQPTTLPEGAFQKAVAGHLLVERKRTLAQVERLGVHTVDADPRKLTAPLLRRYLEMRLGRAL